MRSTLWVVMAGGASTAVAEVPIHVHVEAVWSLREISDLSCYRCSSVLVSKYKT